jgi:hypothetical protein
MGRHVSRERDNAKPCTQRAVIHFIGSDSPLHTRPGMLTALRKSGRRPPPSRRSGKVRPITMTSDQYYHRMSTEVGNLPLA